MTTDRSDTPSIRRIVTGHDAEGRAVVWKDDIASNHKYPNEYACATTIWTTEGAPADYTVEEDGGARIIGSAPPEKGTRFSHLVLQPGYTPPHVHRTDTLDYNIVMRGHPTMYLDDGVKVELKPGDVVIQRGTNHGWGNHTDEEVHMLGVLIDGGPKREGSVAGMQTADTTKR